jgi:prepilin-type N-terminal cleavage/methylation domain-containing protein
MSTRRAFTLIELMIVMAIIVSVLAIAWPRMRRLAAKTQIREAAIEFKAACTEARDRAARSAKPVDLRYQFGRSRFRLSESDQVDLETDSVIQVNSPVDSQQVPSEIEPYSEEYKLTQGVVFDDPSNHDQEFDVDALDDRSDLTDRPRLGQADKLKVGQNQVLDWTESERITFYPEGRSTSATVRILATDSGDSIMLTVRGLTAGVSIGDVEKPIKKAANDAP